MDYATYKRQTQFGDQQLRDTDRHAMDRRSFLKRASAAGVFASGSATLVQPVYGQFFELAWLNWVAEKAATMAISWLVTKAFDWGLQELQALAHRIEVGPVAHNQVPRESASAMTAPSGYGGPAGLILGPDTTVTPSGAPIYRRSVQPIDGQQAQFQAMGANSALAYHYSYPEISARNLVVKPVYSPRLGVSLAIPGRPQCRAANGPILATGGLTLPEMKAMGRETMTDRTTLWVPESVRVAASAEDARHFFTDVCRRKANGVRPETHDLVYRRIFNSGYGRPVAGYGYHPNPVYARLLSSRGVQVEGQFLIDT